MSARTLSSRLLRGKGPENWFHLAGFHSNGDRSRLYRLRPSISSLPDRLESGTDRGGSRRNKAANVKLTSYSNYTLRVLMVAAARFPGLTTIGEVANGFGISKTHLVKCVHQLGGWGYLGTIRGNKGGFRLARPSDSISLGEIIRRTEDGFALVECFDQTTNTCPLMDRCRLRPALLQATEAFLATLDAFTLADISDNGDEILDVLHLARPRAAECAGIRPTP